MMHAHLLRRFLLSSAASLLLLTSAHAAETKLVESDAQIIEQIDKLPNTLTASYLSARLAQQEEDLNLAAHFYAQALELEPDNPVLLERNFALTLAIGNHDRAFKLADRMAEMMIKAKAEAEEKIRQQAQKKEQEKAQEQASKETLTPAEKAKAKKEKSQEQAKDSNKSGDEKKSDKIVVVPQPKEKPVDAKEDTAGAESETIASLLDKGNSIDGKVEPMVHLALGVKSLKTKAYSSATKSFEEGITALVNRPVDLLRLSSGHRGGMNSPRLLSASAQYGPFAQITHTILQAWSLIGQGKENLPQALKLLSDIDRSEVDQFFYNLHSGLIASYAKDYDKAISYLQSSFSSDSNSLPTAQALLSVLLKAERKKQAQIVLDKFMKGAASIEEKTWLKMTYGGLEQAPSFIRTPQEGAAELFSTLGDALSQEQALEGGALYLQFADYLRPKHARTQFALARLHERMEQDEEALVHYDNVPKNDPLYRDARRQSGLTLSRLKRGSEAVKRLNGLLESEPGDLETVSILARVLQAEDNFTDSIAVLTKGLGTISKERNIHWSLYFLRGTAYDQIKQWPKTEADMQRALELFPNQPTVLNYLGYSWVDRGLHLDKALEMIRQAVALRPYDGFFVDSLGWAHYRLKQYKDAVTFLERAVELRPEDPTITDHLGDAYWQVGRKNEARFQWERVKTLSPKKELLDSITEKLSSGLQPEKLKGHSNQ